MTDRRVRFCALILIAALTPAALPADGGGGFFFGSQTEGWPFLEDLGIHGNTLGLSYGGGYGYGIDGHEIHGGFGVGMSDGEHASGISAGYGGVIYGLRGLAGPVNLMLTSWTGIGGVHVAGAAGGEERSYFIFTEEVDLEIGIPILPWFMPTFYVGYQVVGNLSPGRPFRDFFSYTPVTGIRFAWGKFY
jgi:hypothetical protein